MPAPPICGIAQWVILTCKAASTVRLLESMGEAGFPVWTPVRRQTLRRARWNAKRNVKVPLCAGILFADAERLADLAELAAMPVKPRHAVGLKRLLMDPMRPDHVPVIADAALEPLREAEKPARVRRKLSPFGRNDAVTVIEGSFTGFPAIIERAGRNKALVWITVFGRDHRVELPTSILRLDEAYELRSETGTAAKAA